MTSHAVGTLQHEPRKISHVGLKSCKSTSPDSLGSSLAWRPIGVAGNLGCRLSISKLVENRENRV
eukprot:1141138-Pelagomonas_calceolata.AAC.1